MGSQELFAQPGLKPEDYLGSSPVTQITVVSHQHPAQEDGLIFQMGKLRFRKV
jgi:hypothetical protein